MDMKQWHETQKKNLNKKMEDFKNDITGWPLKIHVCVDSDNLYKPSDTQRLHLSSTPYLLLQASNVFITRLALYVIYYYH